MKLSNGFTLLELMIVITILSILMLIAIPKYQAYLMRARIAEGMQLAGALKPTIVETYLTQGKWPENNEKAGISKKIHTKNITQIFIDHGAIVIEYDVQHTGLSLGENELRLEPMDNEGAITWQCNGGSLPQEVRPSVCRDNLTLHNG